MAIVLHYDGSRHDSVTVTLSAMCLTFQFCPTVSCGWLRLSDWLYLGVDDLLFCTPLTTVVNFRYFDIFMISDKSRHAIFQLNSVTR